MERRNSLSPTPAWVRMPTKATTNTAAAPPTIARFSFRDGYMALMNHSMRMAMGMTIMSVM
ncbi:hypothetical protein D3C86_2243680 [compost metagenome]